MMMMMMIQMMVVEVIVIKLMKIIKTPKIVTLPKTIENPLVKIIETRHTNKAQDLECNDKFGSLFAGEIYTAKLTAPY
jgi:stage III sporulation protein SpoIIIAA